MPTTYRCVVMGIGDHLDRHVLLGRPVVAVLPRFHHLVARWAAADQIHVCHDEAVWRRLFHLHQQLVTPSESLNNRSTDPSHNQKTMVYSYYLPSFAAGGIVPECLDRYITAILQHDVQSPSASNYSYRRQFGQMGCDGASTSLPALRAKRGHRLRALRRPRQHRPLAPCPTGTFAR